MRKKSVSFLAETVAYTFNSDFYCKNQFYFIGSLTNWYNFQGPIKTLKNVATKAVQKTTDSGVDCPLMFDDTRQHSYVVDRFPLE